MAARPIWKGAINFGLVHVPVTLFGLEKREDVSFKLLDSRTKSTIKYQRINESTGEEVPWDKIVKGYELSKNNYVIMEDEDFKKAAVEASQTIEIIDFVPREEISDLYIDKPYALIAQKKAEKGYVLLRDVLAKSDRAGIAKVVIRTREYLSAVVTEGQALVLILLRFPNELRSLAEFDFPSKDAEDYKVTKKEMDLAQQLVDSQTTEWDPEQYHDDYRDKLLAFIEEKAEKGEVTTLEGAPDEEPEMATNVIDLAELLRQSVGAKSNAKKAPVKTKKTKGSKSA
jgi:DNA end-binding protein Ku